MTKQERRDQLSQVLKTRPFMTGVRLTIKGNEREFNVYQIPLNCLVYNPHNGRFKSKFKTYEALHKHQLDAENPEDIKIIHDFLWNSNVGKNKQTLEDIQRKGQQVYGIVTRDGYIVDGNRRFMLLTKLNEQYPTQFEYFKGIILDEDIGVRDLVRLETEVQLGMDEKEGYNAIEKYLRVDELLNQYHYRPEAIAEMMNIRVPKVNEYQQIYHLFNEYLEFINYPQHYDLLEGVEDPIIQLRSTLTRLERGSHTVNSTRTVHPEEIEQLKLVIFDTIRLKPTNDHKIVRDIIGGPRQKTADGIFGRKEIWDSFYKKHEEQVHKRLQPAAQAFKYEYNSIDTELVIQDIEKSLQREFQKPMRDNLTKAIRAVEIDNEDDKVLVIIDTIKDDVTALFEKYYDLLVAQYSDDKNVKEALKQSIDYLKILQQALEEA